MDIKHAHASPAKAEELTLGHAQAAPAKEQQPRSTAKGAASMVETRKKTPGGSVLTLSSLQRCLSTLCTLFSLYGFDPSGWSSAKTLQHWKVLCDDVGGEDAWLKVAKYKLAAFFSAHTDQPVRPVPPFKIADDPSKLLGGRASRWVRVFRLRSTTEEWRSFVTSVLYSKKGFPRPSVTSVRRAEQEAITKLSTERKTPAFVSLHRWSDAEKLRPSQALTFSRSDAQRELRRTVREVFTGRKYTIEDRVRPFVPSTSANYNNTRSAAGAIGAILGSDLLDGLRHPRTGVTFNKADEKKNEQQHDRQEGGFLVDTTDFDDRFRRFYWRLLRAAMNEGAYAVPVGLPEALKVRVITKGPPLTNTVLKPLQKFMWRTLANTPCFQLVGTPVTAEILQSRLGERLELGELYLSGDYTDATNNLHSWVSETIVHELAACCDLSAAEHELMLKSLTGHVLEDEHGVFHPQRTGQLMGSISSFPILCLANAALTRYALEQADGRKIPLKAVKALFNGDDIVARTTPEGCRLWRSITAYAGLSESVGKTYYSREFLNVNSTNFSRLSQDQRTIVERRERLEEVRAGLSSAESLTRREGPVFVQTKYVNMGLFLGYKRSGLKVGASDVVGDSSKDVTFGARARELKRLCPTHLQDRVMTEFVRRNAKVLKQFHVPWFIPEWLGGIGLPSFFDDRVGDYHGPTMLDVRRAGDILWNKLDRVRSRVEAGWKIHAKVLTYLPSPAEPLTAAEDKIYNTVYGRLCAATLFDSRNELSDLYDPEGANAGTKNLRANEKLWARANVLPRRYTRLVADRIFSELPQLPVGVPVAEIRSLQR